MRQRPIFVAQKRQYGKGDAEQQQQQEPTPAEKAGLSGVSRSIGRKTTVDIKSPATTTASNLSTKAPSNVPATVGNATPPAATRGPGYEPRKANFEVGRG